ncbi:hypothetical protein Tco_1199991 [Tanacetum coccineum]
MLNLFRVKQRVVIQLVLWIVDSGCSKHMTGNLQLLNFVEKFIGTVRFGNDHFTAITGYGDFVQGNITICHNLEGDDLLTGSRDSNLYTISIFKMAASSPNTMRQVHSSEVLDNSAANTLDNDNTFSSSSIIVEEDEAPQIVSSSAEQVTTELNSSVLNENADEFIQEDIADFDENVFYNAPPTLVFDEAESSSTYQDPSNMHEFHQKHRSSDRWTKIHPVEQVIGDPSKHVMIRN